MQQLVECVPNFSEGRDRAVLDAIAASIRAVPEVELLDVDPGADTNRTVFTFVGPPEPVQEAAFQAIKTAGQLIDMRQQKGAHPRMGATDVCPFIPVENIEVAECVKLAEALGERVANELNIPVYLYEHAARSEPRRNLANIRAGEYEGLQAKMQDPAWTPDYGTEFNPRSGATVIGVREFLIAYNVNLNTSDKRLAHDIALSIREAGRARRDDKGNIVKDADGNTVKVPGLLQHVKAVGWYIDSYRQAQVSINLTNYKVTPPHVVYDVIRAEAEKRGLLVTGSELVGLIPLEAMRMAGRHYFTRQGRSAGVPEEQLVEMAMRSLGLDQIAPFDPQQKIIEYRFRKLAGPLASLTVREFANVLSTDAPAPGGGSAAALGGALAASLVGMVANLTANAPRSSALPEMGALAERMQNLKDAFLADVDRDTDAFNALMAAMRSKSGVDEATRGAIAVPMDVLKRSVDVLHEARTTARNGMQASASDAGVGAAFALAAARGAYYNVLINVLDVKDEAYKRATLETARKTLEAAAMLSDDVCILMEQRLGGVQEPVAAAACSPPAG